MVISNQSESVDPRPHVVIVGGGFAGLSAAKALRKASVRITLVDRRNHHLFQPLLYQVATAALSGQDIATPIREVFRRQKNTTVLMSEAQGIKPEEQKVILPHRDLTYDYLILAAGADNFYYGNDEWERHAPGLKTLGDAVEIRRRILMAYEAAEAEHDPERRKDYLTFVIIGGGPTGVEMAGAMAEIARKTLTRDFRTFDPSQSRIILLEGGPRLLPTYPEELSESGRKQLETMGVEVRVDAMVSQIDGDGAVVRGERIPSRTVIWAAGVTSSPLTEQLGTKLDKQGRVHVTSKLTVPEHEDIFVVGDLAVIEHGDDLVPALAQSAMQEGKHAALNAARAARGRPLEDFHYKDKGQMATIGRSRAVAVIGKSRLSGFVAWILWSLVHLFYLVGFRNRIAVMLGWIFAYVAFRRNARVLLGDGEPTPRAAVSPALRRRTLTGRRSGPGVGKDRAAGQ